MTDKIEGIGVEKQSVFTVKTLWGEMGSQGRSFFPTLKLSHRH